MTRPDLVVHGVTAVTVDAHRRVLEDAWIAVTGDRISAIGAGTPPIIPSWGNIMAEGRTFFRIKPELILYPGLALSLCILSINLLGDAARDMLDPRLKKRAG